MNKKIECVIVCKNYGDYLELTLKENLRYFDNIIIVTSPKDYKVHELVSKYNEKVSYLIYNDWNKNGAIFNKGGAVQFGLDHLKYNDWVVILDSDIVIKEDFRDKLIDINKFYGSYRRFISKLQEYKDLNLHTVEEIKNWSDSPFPKIEGSGCGFFQCFNMNNICARLRKKIMGNLYEDSYSAEKVDIDFLAIFCPLIEHDSNLVRMGVELWHLGPHGVNNNGRSEKDEFFK